MDEIGKVSLSKQVENDEGALLGPLATVLALATGGDVAGATDLKSGSAAAECAVFPAPSTT